MKLLDTYLLRRYLLCLGGSVLALLLVSVVVDLIEHIDTFIDHSARPLQILAYYFYHTPYWLVLTLPIAALLGTLFALTSLARHNEIMAMKAAGLSLYRILWPLFVFALLFSGLVFLFADRVLPAATYHQNDLWNRIRSYSRSDGSRRHVLLQDAGGQIVFARSYDARRKRAHDILWEEQRHFRVVRRLSARRLEWRQSYWLLFDGYCYELGGVARASHFDSLKLAQLTLLPEDFSRQQKKPEEMNYAELKNYIARARANGEDTTRHLVDLYLKVSFPFTCFVIVLLGAPIAADARHAGLGSSFGRGILICFVYYSCVKGGQALGWNEMLSPLMGAWLANLVFGALGLLLLWRTHK